MVSDFFRGRVDPALTTEYPAAFNVRQDLVKSGKSDKFIRQLNAALSTRNIKRLLTDRACMIEEMLANSSGAYEHLYDNQHVCNTTA